MNFSIEIEENANCQMVKLTRILKILCGVQVLLGVSMMFFETVSGLWLIFEAMFFVMMIWMRNWCITVMFVVYILSDFVCTLAVIGDKALDFKEIECIDVLYCLKLPFDFLVLFYCFLAYRELKALYVELCTGTGRPGYGTVERVVQQPPEVEPPFQGPGFRLG